MVLSIGMIVKNEEKYLERCLTALQPILNELDSELIIADTGSTDNTVEIAKKFTDNVYHFEWINDFSAARNSTMDRAQGEWYMFIDADEIVADCSDLIRFFKSGEYRDYKTACYIQRSYSDATLKNYHDLQVPRVVFREGRRFKRPIHETLQPLVQPLKFLNMVADHYGYIFSDKGKGTELASEKAHRNLDILFQELEEAKSDEEIDKNSFNIYKQIADCYGALRERGKQLEYLNIGIEKLNHEHNLAIIDYYASKINLLFNQGGYDEVIETADEYFDTEKNPFHTKDFASDCYIYAMRGRANFKLGNDDKAIADFVKFFDLYNKYTKGRLYTMDLLCGIWRVNEPLELVCYDVFFCCCNKQKKYALANDYAKAIPLEKFFGNQYFFMNHILIRIEIMENVGYGGFIELYRKLDDFGKGFLIENIRKKLYETTPKNRSLIIRSLEKVDENCARLAGIYRSYFEDNTVDADNIGAVIGAKGSKDNYDLLYIMLKSQTDITPFLERADFFVDEATSYVTEVFPNGYEAFGNYDISCISPKGTEKAIELYGCVASRAVNDSRPVTEVFEQYGALSKKWQDESEGKRQPRSVVPAALAYNIVSAKKEGNKEKFLQCIEEHNKIIRYAIPVANAYKAENESKL